MHDHTIAATLCCGLHGLPLVVSLRYTLKSGQAIPALTQQAKGAVGAAAELLQQGIINSFSLITKDKNATGKI